MQYPYSIYEYPAHVKLFTNITNLLGEPIVLFTALTALGAIVAATAAVNANKPNSREKTDILKCEILNFVHEPTCFKTWEECVSKGVDTPNNIAELLDMERSKQIIPDILRKGVLGTIFKSRKYAKYEWVVYITGAMVELGKEGYENVKIGINYKPQGG